MKIIETLKTGNLRDWGATFWENSSPNKRKVVVTSLIGFAALAPFMGFGILDTPVSDYGAVLVYPVGMFILMALGLNIVVGKSGLLDLGYVAFFAIGAYTMAILGTRTSLNTWEIMPIGIALAMLAGLILGLPALRLRGDY